MGGRLCVVPCLVCGEDGEAFLEEAVTVEREGACWIHVYDPIGESAGAPQNVQALRAFLKRVRVPVWYEGGVKSFHLVEMLLGLGFAGVVLAEEVLHSRERATHAWGRFGARVRFGVSYPFLVFSWGSEGEFPYHVWFRELPSLIHLSPLSSGTGGPPLESFNTGGVPFSSLEEREGDRMRILPPGEALKGISHQVVLDFSRLPGVSREYLCNLMAGASVEWEGIVVSCALYPVEECLEKQAR